MFWPIQERNGDGILSVNTLRVEMQMEISQKTEINKVNTMKRQNTKSLAGCKAKEVPRLQFHK